MFLRRPASAVPFVAERIDLRGKAGEILVCSALVVLDDSEQALSGGEQAREGTLCAAGSIILLDRHRPLGDKADVGGQIKAAARIGGDGRKSPRGQFGGKGFADRVVAMHHKDPLRLGRKMPDPGQQALFVGMAADSGETGNLRLDLDGFSEELNRLGSFENLASEAADRLIADKEDRALPAPEVVLEMVA